MKSFFKLKLVLAVVVGLVLITAFSSNAFAAGQKVYVETLSAYDARTIQVVNEKATSLLTSRGFQVVQSKAEAELVFGFNITNLECYRSFNWWILLCGLWPIIPLTTGEGVAMVNLTVKEGNTVAFSSSAGGHMQGRFVFGDFVSSNELKGKALEEGADQAHAQLRRSPIIGLPD